MSFLSTNPGEDKKTALKLINKYADSYNCIIQENNFLKSEIKDLKDNLKINKQIIQGFFSNNKNNSKYEKYILYYKEENEKLYEQNNKLLQKIENLISKFSLNEQILNETINKLRDENDKYESKIFLVEQINNKKDYIIFHQKKKLDELKNNISLIDTQEILITNPTKAILQLNDELLFYKDIYKNYSKAVKNSKKDIIKYKKQINLLETENQNLRNQYKNYIFHINNERDKLIFQINKNKKILFEKNKTENGVLIKNKKNNYKDKKNKTEKNEEIEYRKFENEEFLEICKNVGLTKKEFEIMSKDEKFIKLTDSIELLFKCLVDRNITINLLQKENDNINKKNFKLNKDNMDLFQENLDLKEQLNKLKESFLNMNNKTTSISSSNSLKNNINNHDNLIIKNTMINYEKFITKQLLEKKTSPNFKNNKINDSGNFGEDEYSDNNSMIYSKNIIEEKEIKLDELNGKENKDFKLVKPIKFDEKKKESLLLNNNINEKNNNIENKFGMTIGTVTSSEFREGCKGVDSFLLTIKQIKKDNGNEIKEKKINLFKEN